ncbi:PEGA domain-containing protein [Porphyromonas endodontalis]
MKTFFRNFALLVVGLITLASCASTTIINSVPQGAAVYINQSRVGTTPYTYSDTKILGSVTPITLKLDGYEDFHVMLTRNERVDAGAIVGGLFCWVPFLWTMQYDPSHTYEMVPLR